MKSKIIIELSNAPKEIIDKALNSYKTIQSELGNNQPKSSKTPNTSKR
jgi:hypothetical protein